MLIEILNGTNMTLNQLALYNMKSPNNYYYPGIILLFLVMGKYS
jgi:hypothetical protein